MLVRPMSAPARRRLTGAPKTMPPKWATMPVKIKASSTIKAIVTIAYPSRNPATNIPSSLTNMPNGGSPVMAKTPSSRSEPRIGVTPTTPRIARIRRTVGLIDAPAGRDARPATCDTAVGTATGKIEMTRHQRGGIALAQARHGGNAHE